MNLNELRRQLLAAARAHPPDDHVPYAFEKRIIARLTEKSPLDSSAWWLRGLWRAAVSCVAICVLAGAWTFIGPVGASSADELSQQFENTVFAALEHDGDYTW